MFCEGRRKNRNSWVWLEQRMKERACGKRWSWGGSSGDLNRALRLDLCFWKSFTAGGQDWKLGSEFVAVVRTLRLMVPGPWGRWCWWKEVDRSRSLLGGRMVDQWEIGYGHRDREGSRVIPDFCLQQFLDRRACGFWAKEHYKKSHRLWGRWDSPRECVEGKEKRA